MSRSVDIRFTFAEPVTFSMLLDGLKGAGWGTSEPAGLSYMIDIDDEWEWHRTEPSASDSVVARVDEALARGSNVGMVVYHHEEETGGQLLVLEDSVTAIFLPTVGRRGVGGAEYLTDLSWYLGHLVPPLVPMGLMNCEAQDQVD